MSRKVEVREESWHDAARGRAVPVRIYVRAGEAGPAPVIVFSHGVGGSRAGYAYLGQHWAGQGYVCVHLEHLGTNAAVWQTARDPKAALRAAAIDPQNVFDRVLDVRFAIDQLERFAQGPGLGPTLDLERIGAAGHSMGAYTTLGAAGEILPDAEGREHSLADARIKAVVAMSPSAPRSKERLDAIFRGVRVPVLHLTGTRDESPIGLTRAAERRTAFDHIAGVEQYLVVLRDGDHMTFADLKRGATAARGRQAVFHPLILAVTTAFWDAYLRANAGSRHWLDAELPAALAEEAIVERKTGS